VFLWDDAVVKGKSVGTALKKPGRPLVFYSLGKLSGRILVFEELEEKYVDCNSQTKGRCVQKSFIESRA
jgi:hypothetical protein